MIGGEYGLPVIGQSEKKKAAIDELERKKLWHRRVHPDAKRGIRTREPTVTQTCRSKNIPTRGTREPARGIRYGTSVQYSLPALVRSLWAEVKVCIALELC